MSSFLLGKRLALLRERVVAAPPLRSPTKGRAVLSAVRASSSSSSSSPARQPRRSASSSSSTRRKTTTKKPKVPAADAAAPSAAAVDAATARLLASLVAPVCGDAHCFEGASALRLQGYRGPLPDHVASVSVQQDHLPALEARAAGIVAGAVVSGALPAEFAFPGRKGFSVLFPGGGNAVVYADAGAVLRADPRRVAVELPPPQAEQQQQRCFARSLLAMARHGDGGGDNGGAGKPGLAAAAEARLREQQRETSARNIAAWAHASSSSAYDAWVQRFGPPAAHAATIAADPGARLGRPLLRALLPPLEAAARQGRAPRAANLMGSHGAKALALALLPLPMRQQQQQRAGGRRSRAAATADATTTTTTTTSVLVVDGSPENARYGREMVEAASASGAAASVAVEYAVADVLDEGAMFGGDDDDDDGGEGRNQNNNNKNNNHAFDAVFLELGCLHYFLDPLPLFRVAFRLLRREPTSRLVVRDFHPVSAKLLDAPLARTSGAAATAAAREARRVQARRAARKGLAAAGRRGGGRDYFSEALVETPVAFSKHHRGDGDGSGNDDDDGDDQAAAAAAAAAAPAVLLRQHTLGDIVTVAARAGFAVEYLEEEAGTRVEDAGVPKLFTLVCALR